MNDSLHLLKKSLENLSKPYEEQLRIFPDYVDVFDEAISDFDNAFRLLPTLMQNNIISYNAIKKILECYNLIELNLSIEERCSNENFENSEHWNLVRRYAKEAFLLL